MITRRTKAQLMVFVAITVLGVTYVGAQYAKLDRLFLDRSFEVVAHFEESGGIFVGGEVTYRGVRIGQVSDMRLTENGVDVVLDIENKWDEIPADARAMVGNRSAIGEQYVELQPRVDDGPYLEDGSSIHDTAVPIRTEALLENTSRTVSSVNQDALRTTVSELAVAFDGTGEDLQQIIDTGNAFIAEANEKFDVTTALIRSSNTVLRGQIASESSLRTFATELSRFSTAMVGADDDLRRLIDTGSGTLNELRAFIEANEVPLHELMRDLVTTGRIVVKHLPSIEYYLVVFPWVVEGAWSVVSHTVDGVRNAHFGMILSEAPVCTGGYEETNRRDPFNGEDWAMDTQVGCTEPISESNQRGPQNLPRSAPAFDGAAADRVVGSYDASTGEFVWADELPEGSLNQVGSVAPPSLGKDSWKWLYLQPLLDNRE
jgi:phospholipid/cholesterol/gamma-HCH transport system substrate-binding protein